MGSALGGTMLLLVLAPTIIAVFLVIFVLVTLRQIYVETEFTSRQAKRIADLLEARWGESQKEAGWHDPPKANPEKTQMP